ncbi:restriction endonuclease [Lentisphaerota bacterium WC36G]|nr:restriction endonuclease [Lentisphaerae bacterium WC36]
MIKNRKQSRSRELASKVIYEALTILKKNDGELPGREVVQLIQKRVHFNEWENQRYEKTNNIRWQSILHFFTIDCVKAGFMKKEKGLWILTTEGEKALKKSPADLLDEATAKYREWEAKRNQNEIKVNNDDDCVDDDHRMQKINLDQLQGQAIEGLKDFVCSMNPYEFQDLVAALLRGMGYYTPFVSPKGKDGGIDVIAYQDPLGVKPPRIKVQVKHKPEASISVAEIRSLLGVLSKDGDVGLFVTSGRFSSAAKTEARTSHTHIELIDFASFINLWQNYYHKLTDEEKNMLPLQPIYFLGSND